MATANNNLAGQVWGVALAGGNSSRMGSNKALLPTASGKSFLDHTLQLLGQVTWPCIVSTKSSLDYCGYPCVFDKTCDFGPLAGIGASLQAARNAGAAAIMVLACDLPLLQPEFLRQILSIWKIERPLLAVWQNPFNEHFEMTAGAIYASAGWSWVEKAVLRKRRGLYGIFEDADILKIKYRPEDAPYFANCNTRDDYRQMCLQIHNIF